jgi:CubicO group peptidase (beta-lactamase class C family)
MCLTILLGLGAGEASSQPPTKAPASERAIRALVDSLGTAAVGAGMPGLSVAVARGHRTIVARGFGYADVENRVPAGPETVYHIGSITKQFTAAAILQLVDAGKLRLTDTLGAFVPEVVHGRSVTVEQMVHHTSGIKSLTGDSLELARTTSS